MTLTELGWILRKAPPPPLECDLELGQSISQNWNVDQSVRHSHVIKWGAVIGLDARPPFHIYLCAVRNCEQVNTVNPE